MDQQITALLRQQQQQQVVKGQNGVEFIVETKIRTVDGKSISTTSSQPPVDHEWTKQQQNQERSNYFMRTFDDTLEPQRREIQAPPPPQSSLIKIPLLNSRYLQKPDTNEDAIIMDTSHRTNLPHVDLKKSVPLALRPNLTQV